MLFTAVSCHLGCSKTPTPIPQPEPAKPEMYITSLSLKEFPGVETEIDNSSKTIYMTLPYGASLGKATIIYETSEGITGSPASGSQVDIAAPVQIFLKDAEGNIVDEVTKRIGFRKTEIIDGVFYLNGKPIKVNAQCTHMQHPELGHAMDEATIRKDMEMLKQFNFNAVRTSHYPPVNEYLELADEYGLYIIDEAGVEAHATEYISNIPDFIPMYQERVRRMVLRDRNYACVLFWSAGNESGEGVNITEVVKEGRRYDPTRYWMYGGNAPKHAAEDIVGCSVAVCIAAW